MSNLRKRPSAYFDLTGDDENQPQPKQARVSVNQLAPSSQGSSSQLQVPSASQPLGSQRDAWGGSTALEEEEIIDLTQEEEGFGWTCIGAIDGKIVGIRYYVGVATVGEQVMVKREPGNPYDSNAIRIDNAQGVQIGHIPRQLASKLASYLVCTTSSLRLLSLTRDRMRNLLSSREYSRARRDLGTAQFASGSLDLLRRPLVQL